MLRNSFKYVDYSDLKKFLSDFKAAYNAPNETAAWSELEVVREKWRKKYPYAISNWEDVNSFFQFSDNIRRSIYTTNIIEALNRQYRKVTKTKSVFSSDQSWKKCSIWPVKISQKIDSKIPWMGSGIESVDRVVRGTADTAFIKEKSQGGHVRTRVTLTNTLFRPH